MTRFYHFGISTLAFWLSFGSANDVGFDVLKQRFASPGTAARPQVFWHWINGNVRRDALDADVDALHQAGHGGALIYDVNAGLPQGPIDYGSEEWLNDVVHAVKALGNRGMLAAMHNAPGYSGIGNPQLPVNMTMKQLVWTETRVASNTTSPVTLPRPFSKLGVYEDIFTLAYPVLPGEADVFRDAVASILVNGEAQNTKIAKTIDRERPLRLDSKSSYLDISMKDYFTAQAVMIYRVPETPKNTFDGARDYPPSWTLKVSNDSAIWTTVTVSGNYPALRQMDAPAVLTFAPVVAKYFRLQPSGASWVSGLDISSSARLPNWAVKAHGAPGTNINPGTVTTASATINPDTIVDLTNYTLGTNGTINWRPKKGTYTVVRIGYTVTGQDMPATPDTAHSLSVDLFSKAAIDAHFDTHLTRVIGALKPYIPNTFYGFEVDSYELGQQNWGGDLEADFHQLRGYSLRPWILAATGRIIESAAATEKFLYDFRLTHSNLVATNCYGYFSEKLNKLGLSLLVEPYGDGPFDGMELAAAVDLAYGEFWSHYTYGSDGYSILGSSSAGLKSMNLQPAEAFTGQPDSSAWTEYPYQLKAEGDRMMTFGVNRFFYHSYVHQPVDIAPPGMTMGPFGAHFDRLNTWSKQADGWNMYLTRVSSIMQMSQKATEIGCFVGEEPTASAVITYNTPYEVPLSYQADIFSRSGLLSMTASNGRAVYPSGTSFSVLIFPALPSASAEVLSKILELADGGVKILLLDANPTSRSITLSSSDGEVVQLANKLWGKVGNGIVFGNQTISELANTIGLLPDLTYTASSNDASIYYIHKVYEDEHIFFISNGLRKAADTVLSLRGAGVPEVWDPISGDISEAAVWSYEDGRTLISYRFEPSESILIRLRAGIRKSRGTLSAISKDGFRLSTTEPFPGFTDTPWKNVSSSFTVLFWAKPEIFQFGTRNYVFYPTSASAYGSGHALVAVAMGCNGIQLQEATSSLKTIMSFTESTHNFTASGWTHVAVVYSENTPTLYVNGEVLGTGTQSSNVVHPGVDSKDETDKMTKRFAGDIAGVSVINESLSASEVYSFYAKGIPAPSLPKTFSVVSGNQLLLRQNGSYTLNTTHGQTKSLDISTVKTQAIEGPWKVTFPAERLPPPHTTDLMVVLPKLISLKDHDNLDIAHFSGTATYKTTFKLPKDFSESSLQGVTNYRYLLTLGRVENIAAVWINGKSLGMSWLPPYELDLTSTIRLGRSNTLVVEVTNTWPNRLIGDEQLPAEATYNSTAENYGILSWPQWYEDRLNSNATAPRDRDIWGNAVEKSDSTDRFSRKPGDRVSFVAWKHFNASDPLFESGLLGPVTITRAPVINLSRL
ncbi:hypothetical protein KXW24_001091 [Aspergillus fumigatus]|nr:hypothetical protein KXW24_001091 [Aspergillus fumigatus]